MHRNLTQHTLFQREYRCLFMSGTFGDYRETGAHLSTYISAQIDHADPPVTEGILDVDISQL